MVRGYREFSLHLFPNLNGLTMLLKGFGTYLSERTLGSSVLEKSTNCCCKLFYRVKSILGYLEKVF